MPIDRRAFLGSSLGALAATLSPGARLLCGEEVPETSGQPQDSGEELAPDTLFLTWQRDPTTTMTVQWVGPENRLGTSIQYRMATEEIWQTAKTFTKPFPDTELKVHRCELIGLSPGAEYTFQIGTGADVYRFRTMPAKATDTFQFVSGGDCGTGVHAIGTNILAAAQEPYFALIGGDLAYDNGRSPATFLAFLRNYHRHMVDPKGRLIPMLSCVGNHEVNGGYKTRRQDAPAYLSVFDGFFPERTFGVIDIGDYLSIVLLDSGHIAPITGEQTDWLAATLAARQERPHLIVANHVPAYPSYRAPETQLDKFGTGEEQRIHWAPLFERFNVDVVLEHHDHTFKRTHPMAGGLRDKYGVIYLGDGSWGKLRVPKQPEQRPYLAAVGGAYHMTVHRFEGDHRFHVALEESGRLADVCMTSGKRPARKG